ncbi:MAG: hypothetical protein ACRC35_01620 [Angustibacter sp.]
MNTPSGSEIAAWLTGRLPTPWTADDAPVITVDREEITVVIALSAPDLGSDASAAEHAEANSGRTKRWREETRDQRIGIAREAEHRFGRKVSWGIRISKGADTTNADSTKGGSDKGRGEKDGSGEGGGADVVLFTHLAVPVMTRLRQPERQVLDTLVAAGVARSRAHALAWCVHTVAQHSATWLDDLGAAMQQVHEVRERGPVPAGEQAAPA